MAKILVIDDEKNVRDMVHLALANVGHEVQSAADAQSGLELFGDGSQWDLIVLDQRLPNDQEGTQVFAKMRNLRPQTRALLITAYSSVNVAIESIKAGVVSILRKPFSTDQLRLAVTDALLKVPKPATAVNTDDIMDAISRTTPTGLVFNVVESHFDDKRKQWQIDIDVQLPDGSANSVNVFVPRYTIELAKALADCEAMPGNERFWTALAEEALAHYSHVEGKLPPDNHLEVQDIDLHLQRWLDSVMSVQ